MGKLSVANLKYSIESKKKITLSKLIYAIGIRHIGQENAKLLAKNLETFENFINLKNKKNFNDMLNIDGIGDTQIKSIKKFFLNKKNLSVLVKLRSILKILPEEDRISSGILKDKTFMFTGKLDGISRAEAKSLIEKNSGKIISNVNKKLDFLIIGDKPTNRKITEAKSLNIKIISQKEFTQMINSKDS